MIHSITGLVHTLFAVLALVSGAVVFLQPKAGKTHRRIGYIYVASMIVVVVTAFMVFRLTGSINLLHIAAVVSGATLSKGMWHVIRRSPEKRWFEKHLDMMSASYLGLLAAFFAETATRVGMPYLHSLGVRSFGWFWVVVGVVSFLVFFFGSRLLESRKPGLERHSPIRAEQ